MSAQGRPLRALGSRLGLAFVLLAGLALHALDAAAAPPPAEVFARTPLLQQVSVSPNGKRLAMIVTADNGHRAAAVMDLPPKGSPKAVGGFANADVRSVRWVNDDRLVYEAFRPEVMIREGGATTVAVDHDGSNERTLIVWKQADGGTGSRIKDRTLPYGWFLTGALHDGSADVLVRQQTTNGVGETVGTRLARLNTLTGVLQPLGQDAPDHATTWVLDRAGVVRVVQTDHDGRTRLFARPAGSERWELLEDHPSFDDAVLWPQYLEADGTLVVNTRRGRDTLALFAYDLQRRRLDPEPLVALPRYDTWEIETDAQAGRVVGVHVLTDRPQSAWFSTRLASVQKSVDAALPPGRFNRLICGHCETSPTFVVLSQSDRQAGEYFLYDAERRTLTRLSETRPWIDESAQGTRSWHWITARDGLPLPLVLTHPPGREAAQPLPAVVLVHGGPWLRGGDRRWSAWPQFLATRGWRVIEVEFRGSTGFGARHFTAGWKQWGQAMQDDLADAVQWAAQEGWVDKDRVCIVGASYGGYAALMGPIRHPGVYRCAASFVGVTDIELMFTSARSDLTQQSKRYTMPMLIGDPQADAAMLRQASPLTRVAEIKVPLLLAQGTLDWRVPREHADRFAAAARQAGVAVERIDYGDEAHGFKDEKNEADFLARLEKFLSRSLGSAAAR